jgi:hypothetical protein
MRPTEVISLLARARRVVAFVIMATAATSVSAQSWGLPPEALGANSKRLLRADSSLDGLDFAAGEIERRNNDVHDVFNARSIAVGSSLCRQMVDAFVADTFGGRNETVDGRRGKILRYTNADSTGEVICDGTSNDCPNFPRGLSRSGTGILSAGDLPVSVENGARVWLIPPESCSNDSFGPAVKLDRGICLDNGEGCTPVLDVIDTEFLDFPVGGLEGGGLIVLTLFPAKLLHYSSAAIDCRLDGECGADAVPDVLADIPLPNGRLPTGLAILPGGEILVSYLQGAIDAFRIVNGEAVKNRTRFATGLGYGLEGIDAGLVDGEEKVYAAHPVNKNYLKFDVTRTNSSVTGAVNSTLTPGNYRQRPRDVAVNNSQAAGQGCIEVDGNFECKTTTLGFTINGQQNFGPGDTILEVTTRTECDPRLPTDSPRALPLSELGIGGDLGELSIGPNCLGVPVANNPSCRALIISEVSSNWQIDPGAWVEVQADTEDFLPGAQGCPGTGGRVHYHPGPEPGKQPFWVDGEKTLSCDDNGNNCQEGSWTGDITWACENPRRGLGRESSVWVQCSSRLLLVKDQIDNGQYRLQLKEEAATRLENLLELLDEVLDNRPQFREKLINTTQIALDRINEISADMTQKVYENKLTKARDRCFAAAELVADRRNKFTSAPEVGDVLSRFASCSLLLSEEGLGETDYQPPFMGLAGQEEPDEPPVIPILPGL